MCGEGGGAVLNRVNRKLFRKSIDTLLWTDWRISFHYTMYEFDYLDLGGTR